MTTLRLKAARLKAQTPPPIPLPPLSQTTLHAASYRLRPRPRLQLAVRPLLPPLLLRLQPLHVKRVLLNKSFLFVVVCMR